MEEPEVLYVDGFIPERDTLYKAMVRDVDWDNQIRARKTATFGQPYNYSGIAYQATPMHPLLLPIVDRLKAQLGFSPNNCLLNYYETGQNTMGFHADTTEDLEAGTGIAIVSLGAERTLTFRRTENRDDRRHYVLTSGSLLYMTAETQKYWQHGILAQPNTGGRISLTFRQLGR